MIAAGFRREVAASHVLIREGQPVDSVFLVRDELPLEGFFAFGRKMRGWISPY
jgi:hypothetical protein